MKSTRVKRVKVAKGLGGRLHDTITMRGKDRISKRGGFHGGRKARR
jgi:hypothetical protein